MRRGLDSLKFVLSTAVRISLTRFIQDFTFCFGGAKLTFSACLNFIVTKYSSEGFKLHDNVCLLHPTVSR